MPLPGSAVATNAVGRQVIWRPTAPAYLEVGELDILRDETIDYARRLAHAGVSAELHVHPGAVHGFDRFVPDAAVSRRSLADRRRVLANL